MISVLDRRMLIADMVYSIIRPLVPTFESLSLEEISLQCRCQQAGLIWITRMPCLAGLNLLVKLYPPAFKFTYTRTDGSDMLLAWLQDVWQKQSVRTEVLSGVNASAQKAIVLTLQRITVGKTAHAGNGHH